MDSYSSISLDELVRRCSESGEEAAWEEFVRRSHRLIATVVLRTAQRWGSISTALVDDLIQETYLKICSERRRIFSEFQPRHPDAFYGYLKVIAANLVHDHFRAEHSQKRGSARTETSFDEPFVDMPAAISAGEDIHRQILLKEAEAALCAGTPNKKQTRDRIIFLLYYRYGLTAQAIALLPSISLTVKGVESIIHKLTRYVRERLAERDNALR